MDYRSYVISHRDNLMCLLAGGAMAAVIAWLFYRSAWGMLLLPVTFLCCRRSFRKEQIRKRKEQLLYEFKDAMQAVSGALLAGYSMENAWREAEKEAGKMHGEESFMCRELHQMNQAVAMNEPLERVLAEFAVRSGCEEIESFSEIFSFAKRSGGDFAGIIRTTVQKLAGRIEVEREIATVLAGKRLEGRIMNGMPVVILAYLTLTSGDFLEVLYGNLFGVFIMSGALALYVWALRLSAHILDIQV